MKRPLFSVFIVASLMVAIAHCFPGAPRQEDNDQSGTDTVLVLPGGNSYTIPRPSFHFPDLSKLIGDDDDDNLEVFDPFGYTNLNPPRTNLYDSFFGSLQSTMDSIRKQVADGLSRFPSLGDFGFLNKNPNGGNTTSTTKIIDGHVVTINETTYQNSDNDPNVIFRVQTVDVRPVNETGGNDQAETDDDLGGGEEIEANTSTTQVNDTPKKKNDNGETTVEPRSIETVEDTAGNEIPNKNQNDNFNA